MLQSLDGVGDTSCVEQPHGSAGSIPYQRVFAGKSPLSPPYSCGVDFFGWHSSKGWCQAPLSHLRAAGEVQLSRLAQTGHGPGLCVPLRVP